MIRPKRPRIMVEVLYLEGSSSDYDHLPICGLENFDDGRKIIWWENMEIFSNF